MRERDLPPEVLAKILATEGVVVRNHFAESAKSDPMPADMTEKEFQSVVIRSAERQLWLAYHPYLSIKSKAGFPDTTLARVKDGAGRLILAELKTESGTLSKDQRIWRDVLQAIGGNVEYYCWRPSDWQTIQKILA